MRSKPPRWAIRDCSEPEDDTDMIAASATSAVQRPGAFEAAGGYSKSTTRIAVADRTPEGSPHLGQSVGRKATAYSLPCPVHTGERRLTEAIAGAQA
jgi:hypothetical protein